MTVERRHLGALSGNAVIEWLPIAASRHVTSLGHQGKRIVFCGGPKFFKICAVVSIYVQHVFQAGRKNFQEFCPPVLPRSYGPGGKPRSFELYTLWKEVRVNLQQGFHNLKNRCGYGTEPSSRLRRLWWAYIVK